MSHSPLVCLRKKYSARLFVTESNPLNEVFHRFSKNTTPTPAPSPSPKPPMQLEQSHSVPLENAQPIPFNLPPQSNAKPLLIEQTKNIRSQTFYASPGSNQNLVMSIPMEQSHHGLTSDARTPKIKSENSYSDILSNGELMKLSSNVQWYAVPLLNAHLMNLNAQKSYSSSSSNV